MYIRTRGSDTENCKPITLLYHTIIRAALVCLCVPYLPRGPLTDLRQTWWVYVGGTSHLPLRGSFSKRSTGQRVTFAFHYIIYAPASYHTAATAPFDWQAAESNSAPFAVLHVNDVCRWTWQLLLRGSFSKRSTGQTGQQVTFNFTILYMIADDATPLQKAHRVNGSTGHFHFHYIIYDARLTPHRCKKHTASFARSTGKFPSLITNLWNHTNDRMLSGNEPS